MGEPNRYGESAYAHWRDRAEKAEAALQEMSTGWRAHAVARESAEADLAAARSRIAEYEQAVTAAHERADYWTGQAAEMASRIAALEEGLREIAQWKGKTKHHNHELRYVREFADSLLAEPSTAREPEPPPDKMALNWEYDAWRARRAASPHDPSCSMVGQIVRYRGAPVACPECEAPAEEGP